MLIVLLRFAISAMLLANNMKVILLQDIKNIGKKMDIKEVPDGYARNYLLPKKLAKVATDDTIKNIETQKRVAKEEKELLKNELETLIKKINGIELNFYPKIGKKQEVYTSITKKDIVDELRKKLPIEIQNKIHIEITPDKPIKILGEHEIEADLEHGFKTKIKVILNQVSIK